VFRTTMDLNYFGTVNAVGAVLPRMAERRAGHLVLVASAAAVCGARCPPPGNTAPAAAANASRTAPRALLQPEGARSALTCCDGCFPHGLLRSQ